jgi:pimeloyl-ACP methyl ester carboxylesterase
MVMGIPTAMFYHAGKYRSFLWLLCLIGLLLGSCTRSPMLPHTLEVPAQTLSLPDLPPVVDRRARFRSLFCGLLDQPQACEELLLRFRGEPEAVATTRPMPEHVPSLRVILVPGLFNECFSQWVGFYGDAIEWLRVRGYEIETLLVNSRSSSGHNAAQIAAYVASLPVETDRPLVLIGHSKGSVDILQFLVEYPEPAARVAAVVSIAGAINGSPLADWMQANWKGWRRLIPSSLCDPGDEQAIESLTRLERLTWLSKHPLPTPPHYFSLVAVTEHDTIAWPLRYTYRRLAEIDPRNDGQLLFYDQVIPGSELLGYVHADHWRIAYPIEGVVPFLAAGETTADVFPRQLLLLATLLYVEEVLASDAER